MRIRFAGYLAMGVVSAFLIVASYGFAANTFWWIALIGGIVLALLGIAEVALRGPRAMVAAPAAVAAVLGVVMAVIAVAASAHTAANWGFGLAIATAALSVLGLTQHEILAEREIRADREILHPAVP